ncbi:autotransporter domain-containing protein [Novosphingobium sp. G106]|uniref:autotransporter outer membrane beta-barrel domain-containing protein n=1 Tax=Novosphingobium sp. G106 TaxID=2849500 RepID=UPI001C2D2111|nr:autotransporter domain-containing protein [Novosphingobium sp. G106]MBV1688022.1 autotransporter domain-containing protein [Novosphingobium sp. G106]
MNNCYRKAALLASAAMLCASPAIAADIVIATGTTDTTQKSVGGMDTLAVEQGGTLSVTDTAIKWNGSSTDLRITNDGTIESTDTEGRAINAGGSATAPRTVTLLNNGPGIIRSEDDAIRINTDITDGTVRLTNAGTILSTIDGQAIDFDAVASTASGQIQIDNLAGGIIQSTDADAVRPGEGADVNNAGTIYAGKVANDSSDGVDFQAHSGTVTNLVDGVISGARHGVTTSEDVTVVNYGTIIGRNGSGVGSDGTATVINYGRITGAYDGSGNGDGDGVDIDNGGTVENYGVIEALGSAGVTSAGEPAGSDGVTIGGNGGTVINHQGATIYSVGGAVPISKGKVINDGTITGGSVGVLWGGASTLTNTGTVTGAVVGVLGGAEGDTVTNSGTISSPNIALALQGGNDQLTLLPGSIFIGTVDGGDDIDQVTLAGNGAGSFAGAVNFEHLEVASGDWTLMAASVFANGTTIESNAALTGSADVLVGLIDDNGTLIVDQQVDGNFLAILTGTGQLIKSGAGKLTIGDQSFSGGTRINAGTVLVNGSLPSAVTVGNGATLGGTGAAGEVRVERGGTIAPGVGRGGTFRIAGDFYQEAGSVYMIGQNGAALLIGGKATLENGALVELSPDVRSRAIGTRFALLSADGGITGNYAIAQDPQANTEVRLTRDGNEIDGVIARTAASLAGIGSTSNQIGVAGSLAVLSTENDAYAALTLDPSRDSVRANLGQLAGEVHASLRTAMTQDALSAQDAAGSHLDDLTERRSVLWTQFLGGQARYDGAAGAADASHDTFGVIAGVEMTLSRNAHIGIAGGYTRTTLDLQGQASDARVGSAHLLAYGGADIGRLRIKGVIGCAFNQIETRRSIAFDGFTDQDRAIYHGNMLHGFGEVGYALPWLNGVIEPFARATSLRAHTDRFLEMGGDAALAGSAHSTTAIFSDLGARLLKPVGATVYVDAGLAWRHAYTDYRSDALLAFAQGGADFTVTGTTFSRNAVRPALGILWKPVDNLRLGASYAGAYGTGGTETRGRITVALEI